MSRPISPAIWLALALLAGLFLYPLGRLLALPLAGAGSLMAPGRAVAVSALLALATGAIAAPIGAWIGHTLALRRGMAVALLGAAIWVLFLVPSYVLTTGWIALFSTPAWRASLLGEAFFGLPGLLLLYVLKTLPFATFVARATYLQAGAAPFEAARVLGLPLWRRLVLAGRLALPAAAAGFAIAGIEAMQEFGIPATLGLTGRLPLLTYVIYRHLATAPPDFARAAALCWWLAGLAGCFTLLHVLIQRRGGARLQQGRGRAHIRTLPSPAAGAAIAALAALLWLLGIGLPGGALVTEALRAPAETPYLGAITRSLLFATLAASTAVGIALALVRLRAAGGALFAALLDGGLTANMAVPGLVLGAGYIVAFNNAWLPLYGTSFLLVLAYAAGMLPVAVRLLQTACAQIDPSLADAARVHSLPRLARALDINAALLAQPALSAWLLVGAAVMFELPVSELLYPPGAMPIGVAIVMLDQMARYGAAARLALLGIAAYAALALALAGALRLAMASPRAAVRA